MVCRLVAVAALAAAVIVPKAALAEANIVRVAKQFGIGYMQYMVMQELKLVEKHAKAAGLDPRNITRHGDTRNGRGLSP